MKENIDKIMQITAFKAILARRKNIRGYEELNMKIKIVKRILSHEWNLIARGYLALTLL